MLEHRPHVDDLAEAGSVAHLLGEDLEQGEVLLDLFPRVGTLDLDDDEFAVREARAVDLGDRPGRERLRVDVVEHVLPRHAEPCSMTLTTCSSLSGGTWSCSVASSSMNSGGRRSGRVERICPSFANVGPSSSSALRTRLPGGADRSSPPRRAGRTAPSARTSRRPPRSSFRARPAAARSPPRPPSPDDGPSADRGPPRAHPGPPCSR